MRWTKSEMLESTRTKNGVIKLSTVDGVAKYISIRAGLDPESQYYVIAGLEFIDEEIYAVEPGHRAIDVLLEYKHESLILDDFFYKMIEDASLYFCDFYMDRDENHNEDFQQAYFHFQSKHRNPHGALLPAPWVDSFRLGLGKIKSLVKEDRLDVDNDTLIFNQITKITQDFEDKDVRTKFFTIEALRHVINSFDRDRPIQINPYNHPGTFGKGPQSWMS